MVAQRIADMSLLEPNFDAFTLLEKRIENDISGNPLYIGYNKEPNESTTSETWLIFKLLYSGGYVVRYQLPDDGAIFKYAWDDRATLFS